MANFNVGDKIAYYRKKRGYTQKKLADMIDLSNSMLSVYERGEYVPSVELLKKIATALNLGENETADLFGVPSETQKEKQKQKNSVDISVIFENSLHFKAFFRSFAKNGMLEALDFDSLLQGCKFSDEEKKDCRNYYKTLKMVYDSRNNDEYTKALFDNFINDTRNLYSDKK